jgi:hypothetical protein
MMVGVFAGHHGGEAASASDISMLPDPRFRVKQPNGMERESYLVDMRSRGGFAAGQQFDRLVELAGPFRSAKSPRRRLQDVSWCGRRATGIEKNASESV